MTVLKQRKGNAQKRKKRTSKSGNVNVLQFASFDIYSNTLNFNNSLISSIYF